VDVGADFFTIHYPHPLVDQRLRCALSAKAAADPAVELLLFDLALGDGVHPDPGPELVEAISSGRHQRGDAPLVVVASVCGTDADPQGAARQRSALAEAGVQIVASASGAARLCAALKAGARGGVT
jgi:FdrA protein